MQQTYIAALEIGSSHLRMAVGVVEPDGSLTLLAKEDETVIDSTSYGWIKNIDDIAGRVTTLTRKIENYPSISPRKIRGVYLGLGGRSLMANSVKIMRQFDDDEELNPRLIEQMKEEARTSTLSERRVLEVSPRSFVIDNQSTTKPIGVLGRKIEAEFNVITARNHGSINLNRIDTLAQRQNLSIKGKFVRQTALARLVLTPEEMDLGCMLVDFGAETVGVSIYHGGSLRYFVTLPIGSRVITRDLMTLNMTEERAEAVKRAIGDAGNLEPAIGRNDFDCNPSEVNKYVYHRAAEIAVNIVEQAKYAGMSFTDIPKGIVLVGGGSNLRGFSDALSRMTHTPVRMGTIPASVRVTDPRMQSLEMLDVIAILKAAADNSPMECTETPEYAGTPERSGGGDYVPVDDDGPGPQPRRQQRTAPAKPVKKQRRQSDEDDDSEVESKPGFFSRMVGKLSGFFDEPEDQEN